MTTSASSPSSVPATRPRIWAIRYGFARSTIEMATRGSRARLRALRELGWVKNAIRPSSKPTHTGTVCGDPSGSTVARWAKFGASSSARTSSGSSATRAGYVACMPVRAGVVVPVHGWAPFLAEALDSVLTQDPAPAAVVVVDDGSSEPLRLHPDHAPHYTITQHKHHNNITTTHTTN